MGAFSSTPTTNEKCVVAPSPETTTTAQDVLRCHMAWLIVLIVASGVMFIAGCVAAVLDVIRQGPDMLDDVKGSLRGSPFVRMESAVGVDDRRTVVYEWEACDRTKMYR